MDGAGSGLENVRKWGADCYVLTYPNLYGRLFLSPRLPLAAASKCVAFPDMLGRLFHHFCGATLFHTTSFQNRSFLGLPLYSYHWLLRIPGDYGHLRERNLGNEDGNCLAVNASHETGRSTPLGLTQEFGRWWCKILMDKPNDSCRDRTEVVR